MNAGIEHAVATPEQVVPLAARLARQCLREDLVAIGLAELIMNGIEHGRLGLGYETKRRLLERGDFHQELRRRLDAAPGSELAVRVRVDLLADIVRFTVADPGAGFDWRPWLQLDEARMSAPNGRGIAIARNLCFESLNYLGAGNVAEAIALRAPETGNS